MTILEAVTGGFVLLVSLTILYIASAPHWEDMVERMVKVFFWCIGPIVLIKRRVKQ